jgi:acetolactate synthase-1/2/3 large subunit
MRSYNPVEGPSGQIRKALQLLLTAKRPISIPAAACCWAMPATSCAAGGHAGLPRHQHADGPGAYPASDRKFLGMLGMHGTIEANNAMQNCDVLLAVGARFDDRVIGNPKHFVGGAQDHPHRHRSFLHLQAREGGCPSGDVKDVLTELIAMIREVLPADAAALGQWWNTIEGWRAATA